MKAIAILTFLLVAAAAGIGVKILLEKKAAAYEYPIHRAITSKDGRTLDAVIHGRSESMLIIERLSDGEEFDLAISQLSAEDQIFAEKLALTTKDASLTEARKKSEKAGDSFIQSRLESIEDLQEKYDAITNEIASGSLSPSILRSRRAQLERVEQEIEELRSAIKQYQYRNKIE